MRLKKSLRHHRFHVCCVFMFFTVWFSLYLLYLFLTVHVSVPFVCVCVFVSFSVFLSPLCPYLTDALLACSQCLLHAWMIFPFCFFFSFYLSVCMSLTPFSLSVFSHVQSQLQGLRNQLTKVETECSDLRRSLEVCFLIHLVVVCIISMYLSLLYYHSSLPTRIETSFVKEWMPFALRWIASMMCSLLL